MEKNLFRPLRSISGLVVSWAVCVFCVVHADPQDDRLAYIEYVKSLGIFELIEVSDNVARLVVHPKFHDSDVRSQAHVTKAVFEYMSNLPGGYTVVQIYDSETGKQIGIITPAGLRLF